MPLVKGQSRLYVRKDSFSESIVQYIMYVWNTLSADCVHASSVNMFAKVIDKYLVMFEKGLYGSTHVSHCSRGTVFHQ